MSRISQQVFDELTSAALRAGRIVMEIHDRDPEARLKDDRTPVTRADTDSEAHILAELARICPETPVVSEEAASRGVVPETRDLFFLVDPLDGTREFLSGNGEFTVNIGLVFNGTPVVGIVYVPARDQMFRGRPGEGAERAEIAPSGSVARAKWRPVRVRAARPGRLVAVASRSHGDERTDALLERHGVSEVKSVGSSLKFCMLAAGEADLYPRTGRTMEWDTAAGQAILAAAGGSVVTEDGEPLVYGKKDRGYDNPSFIARGWQ